MLGGILKMKVKARVACRLSLSGKRRKDLSGLEPVLRYMWQAAPQAAAGSVHVVIGAGSRTEEGGFESRVE